MRSNPISDKWRILVLTILLAGAVSSLWFMFRTGDAGGSAILMILFTGWVLSPFGALLAVSFMAWGQTGKVRFALHWLMILISMGSLLGYSGIISVPGTRPAFIFLMLPLVSWLVILLVIAMARRWSRQSQNEI